MQYVLIEPVIPLNVSPPFSPGHFDTDAVVEALHGCTDGGLQLEDVDAALQGLGVHDHLHVEGLLLKDALDGWNKIKDQSMSMSPKIDKKLYCTWQVHPQVVGVEDLELLD